MSDLGLAISDGDIDTEAIAEYEATRRNALRRGLILGGAAIAATSIPLLVRVRDAFGQAEGDEAILTSAIGLEQTAVVAYETAVGSGLLQAPVRKVAQLFRDQEQEHADALSAALEDLGGKPPKPPEPEEVEGLGDVKDQTDVLNFAIELENMAVVAYDGAAAKLSSEDLVMTGAQIVSNEAQHLVVLRQALDRDPVPSAFEAGRGR